MLLLGRDRRPKKSFCEQCCSNDAGFGVWGAEGQGVKGRGENGATKAAEAATRKGSTKARRVFGHRDVEIK
jgi:hypothetical protein